MTDYRAKVARASALRQIHSDTVAKNTVALQELVELKKVLDEAQTFVQVVARETQEQLSYSLEDIVNMLLSAVFGEMYEFKIIYETKRNKTEARITLLENGIELYPLRSVGGVADILSTGMRIALLMLSSNRKTLLLDEPGKFLSESLKPAYYEMLKSLAQDVGIQIAVTHDKYMVDVADKVYTIRKDEGVSYVQ